MSDSLSFAVGDRVVDTTAEEPEAMYVLDPQRGRADEVYIEALDETVAGVNPEFPADDPVIACVHESWLRHNVGDRWEGWLREDFATQLRDFASEWSLSVRTYDYPASRLAPADGIEASDEAPEPSGSPQREGQTRMDEWLGP